MVNFKKLFGIKQKENPNRARRKQGQKLKCSKCGRDLEPIGSIFDSFKGGVIVGDVSKADLQQWMGWVCTKCHGVYCMECERPTMNQSMSTFCCPNCGQTLKAATAMHLKQIGKL